MGMLISTGRFANVLSTARSITMSPTANALYPSTYLYDGYPGKETRFGSANAGDYVKADLDISTGGDMETFATLGWSNASSGTGAVAQSSTYAYAGTYSARVTGGATPAIGAYRFTATLRTGFRYRISTWSRNTATAVRKFRVYNAETRNYLQSGMSTWGASSADANTATDNGMWQETSVSFTVESFYDCGRRDTVTVYIDLVCTENEFVYFDEFRLWPEIDFVSVHGHNIDALMAPQIRTSTDNFGAVDTLAATMTVRRPSFYSQPSIVARYVMLKFPTANVRGAIRIGELFMGQALAPARGAGASGAEVFSYRRQVSQGSQTFNTSEEDERKIVATVLLTNAIEHKEWRDEVVSRAEGSRHPVAIAYETELDGEVVLYGKLPTVSSFKRSPIDIREAALEVLELPFATVTA